MSNIGSETVSTSPGEFARTLFSSETIASRFVGDTSQDSTVLADYEQQGVERGYGGWEKYDIAERTSQTPLKQGYSGRRVNFMRREELLIDEKKQVAFVTNYSRSGISVKQAHSQMCVWAFCDAIGLDVPRHHWFPDDEIVVVEEVGEVNEQVWDLVSVSREIAERIDQRALLEYISILLIAGNEDLRPPNFACDEEGQVYVFDFDKSDYRFGSLDILRPTCNKAIKTINLINKVRDEKLSIGRDEICRRVQKISTQLQSTPQMDRVLGTVGLYDDIFADETKKSFEEQFRNNIMIFAADDN